MKFKKSLSLLMLSLVSIFMVACSDSTSNPDDNKVPDPADSAKATTTNETTIRVKWKASPTESDINFKGYQVKMTANDGSLPTIDTVLKTYNPLQVTGLTAGTIYTFEIKALLKNGHLSSATSVSWSPAYRFETNNNDAPIKLYETASLLGSGLDVYDQATQKPKTFKVANGEYWSLGLDTRNNKVIISSPTAIAGYNYPTTAGFTEISQNYFDAASLDDVYDSEALNSGSFAVMGIPLDEYATDITKNIVLIIRTKEAGSNELHYAKVLIKKQGSGWLAGTSPDRYIEVIVSYQSKANVPYAKKPIL